MPQVNYDFANLYPWELDINRVIRKSERLQLKKKIDKNNDDLTKLFNDMHQQINLNELLERGYQQYKK